MVISIFSDYSVFDAGKQRNIEGILNKIPEITDNEVTLDFTNCLIDYPATSKLIDKILVDLAGKEGSKKLIILSDLTINNERLLLILLIWGSMFFDFSNLTRTSEVGEFKNAISEKLKEYQIEIVLQLLKDNGSTFNQFKYA